MATLYESHTLGLTNRRPRDINDVGDRLQLIERWANQIPFPELTNSPLAAQQSVTSTTMADVAGMGVSVSPQRVGQIIIVFVQSRVSRFAGGAQLIMQATIQIGTASAVLLPGQWFFSATLDSKLQLIPVIARSTRRHTIQVQAANSGGATTWLVRSPDTSITVLTI